jgi:class 3 adenylate cyclase
MQESWMKAITHAFSTLRNSIPFDNWSRWISEPTRQSSPENTSLQMPVTYMKKGEGILLSFDQSRVDARSLLAAFLLPQYAESIERAKCVSDNTVREVQRHDIEPRRLVTVVYADMVGYSRLIDLDDAGTLTHLRHLRTSVIDRAIELDGGKIIHTGGDSLLMVFNSVNEAMHCAATIQHQIPAYDDEQSIEGTIRFRITINIGDAIFDGTDLHGNVVNVAVRLQAACPPGGICITRAVYELLLSRNHFLFEELGPLSLRNIQRPVEAFVTTPPMSECNKENIASRSIRSPCPTGAYAYS